MITLFKIFENDFYGIKDIKDKDQFFIPNIFDYLNIDIYNPLYYIDHGLHSEYDVDIEKFFEEIFLNKNVIFKSINKQEKNPIISGIVKYIDFYFYDEIYLKFYIDSKNIDNKHWYKSDDACHIVSNENSVLMISNYDADHKPLHKKVKMLKTAEKFNL